MQEQKQPQAPPPITYIQSYLSCPFFSSVQTFEHKISLLVKDLSLDTTSTEDLTSNQLKNRQLFKQKNIQVCKDMLVTSVNMHALKDGQNRGVSLKVDVVRIVGYGYYTFLLVKQNGDDDGIGNEIWGCLIVITSSFYLLEMWQKQMGLNMRLIVKQPYYQSKDSIQNPTPHLHTCVARLQNVIILPLNRWKQKPEQSKTKGNQLFNSKNYYQALLYYEYALSCIEYNDKKLRAILYSNSSACLYEMRLYAQAIRYAKISITIDPNYSKAYFRLISALLEKGQFSQIPSWLLLYGKKVENQKMMELNIKFMDYVANRSGMFNWSMIASKKGDNGGDGNGSGSGSGGQGAFSGFQSDKIRVERLSGGNRECFYSHSELTQYQTILLVKPLFYTKAHQKKSNLLQIVQTAQKYLTLDPQFATQIQSLHMFPTPTSSTHQQPTNTKIQQHIFVAQQLDFHRDTISLGVGIWPQLHKFQHSCTPNCSFTHLSNALVVSTTRPIPPGTPLTLDYAAYIQPSVRKQYLKQRYNIGCECQLCSWIWWPKDMEEYVEILEIVKEIDGIAIMKLLIWEMFRWKYQFITDAAAGTHTDTAGSTDAKKGAKQNNGGVNNIILVREGIQAYLKLMQKEMHWIDILRMVEFMSGEGELTIQVGVRGIFNQGVKKFLGPKGGLLLKPPF